MVTAKLDVMKLRLVEVEWTMLRVDGGEVGDDEIGKKDRKTSKSKNLYQSKKTVRSDFFTLRARLAFIKLKQAFVKTSILNYFNPECHICIEIDISGYSIGGVFSRLTSDDLG